MKFKCLLLAIAGSIGFAAPLNAALIGYWNFNSLSIATAAAPGTTEVPLSIAADSGSATISLAGFTGLVDDFGGSTLNALNGDAAEESLSITSSAGNNSYLSFTFSTLLHENIVLSAAVRGSSTGFTTGAWTYSINGGSFQAVAGNNISTTSTTFSVLTADFSAVTAINNQTSVELRYTVSGATNTSGNNRLDNVQINSVPEPASALLGAIGLLGILRRRR